MGLEAVQQAARTVGEGPAEELAFRLAELGEQLDHALSDAQTLSSLGRQIEETARRQECTSLVGASPIGERLAGAAVAVSANGLHVYSSGDTDPAVLVVDGFLATGTALAWTAQDLKRHGVHRTPAAVVVRADTARDLPAGPDDVEVLLD